MNRIKQEIIDTGKWIMDRQLTWGTSGNLSARDGDRIYITASGTVLGALKEEDLITVDINGNRLEGEGKPSKETAMHLAVYQRCPDVNAVIHASPFYSTFASCTDLELRVNLFIESMYYDERITRVPYCHAGSRELKEAVEKVCAGTRVILMEHHGILVYDTSMKEARVALDVTENVCRMNLMAQMGGICLTELPRETVEDFLEGGYYKKRRFR